MRPDAIYTPPILARRLIGAAKAGFQPATVIDITAGQGELLKAAETKWSKARIQAWDIDSGVTSKLRKHHPTWEVRTVDALDNRTSYLRLRVSYDLVVLNPPFSCRGGAFYTSNLGGEPFRCSRAGHFLVKGLSLLSKKGQLLAILPVGTLDNEKDFHLWQNVNRYYRARVITENCPKIFPGLRIRTLIIRLTKRPRPIMAPLITGVDRKAFAPVDLLRRGSCPASLGSTYVSGYKRLIHTTDINGNILRQTKKRFVKWHWSLKGPLVVIPRVGNPNCLKIACYSEARDVVISDCIFAVSCSSIEQANLLVRQLTEKWPEIKKLYKGTCAQFLTKEKFQLFLVKHSLVATTPNSLTNILG